MKTGSSRGMPTRVKLALLGAVLALGALGLPWMGSSLAAIPHLMGYQDSVTWTGLRVIAALATVVLALQLVKVPALRETQRAVFGASAVVFVLRPITLVVTNPTSSDLSSGGVQLDRVFTPSWGIFASFLAAALMIAAAVMTHRSDDVREAAEREAARAALLEDPELAAFAGPPPAPIAVAPSPSPSPVAPQPDPVLASQPEPVAYAQPEPGAWAPTMPTTREDTGPYGPDGPSRLGDGPNLVQLDDTLAPKHAAPAPHLALMHQPPPPAPAQPEAHVAADQGASTPAVPAEPRQRSVAPPGFG